MELFIGYLVYSSILATLAQQKETTPLDGRRGGIIAFNSDRDGNGNVYLTNAGGSGQRNITNNLANYGSGTR